MLAPSRLTARYHFAMQSDLSRESNRRPTMRAAVSALFLASLIAVASRHGGVLGQGRVPECTRASGGRGQCRPLVKCVRFIHEVTELQKRPCSIGNGERGVCCPHVVIGTATCRYRDFVMQCMRDTKRMRISGVVSGAAAAGETQEM